MHTASEKEKAYFRKVDSRNKKKVEYSFPDGERSTYDEDSRQAASNIAFRSDEITFNGDIAKEKKKRYTSEDFKVTMNSSVTAEISASLQAITTNRFDYRDYGDKDNTQRLASVLLRQGNDISKLQTTDEEYMQDVSLQKKSSSFSSGGFTHNPFSKQKTKKTKKRIFDDISDLPAPKKQPEPTRQPDIKKISGQNINDNIFGVAFCDCKCPGCSVHSGQSTSDNSGSSSSTTMIDDYPMCYYRSKTSKIEYMEKDSRWETNAIDHVQVVDPILESIQTVETSQPLYSERVNIQHLLEILDASNITPISVSLFCHRIPVTSIVQNTHFCFTTAQEDVFNYKNELSCSTSAIQPDELHKSAIKKIEEKYQMVYQSLNRRICLHKSHNNNKQNQTIATNKNFRHLCAVVESRSTIDPRILIRSCFIFQDDKMETVMLNDEDFSKAASESIQYHQNNRSADVSDITTSYMSMISKIYGDNISNRRKTTEDKLEALIRIIVEFSGYNNSDTTFAKGIDLDNVSFHKLDTLETTQKPVGILWNMLKQIEIWRYCRTFALILPAI